MFVEVQAHCDRILLRRVYGKWPFEQHRESTMCAQLGGVAAALAIDSLVNLI
jgi:hypothetical protein